MKGEGSEAVQRIQAIARQLLEQETVVLDVESTGLEVTDEVCEIAIVNHDGEVLLDTRVRPTCAMSPEAQRVHNIDPEALARAPSWAEIHAHVATTLSGRCWTSYGVEFDERVIQMSAAVHGACAIRWCTRPQSFACAISRQR